MSELMHRLLGAKMMPQLDYLSQKEQYPFQREKRLPKRSNLLWDVDLCQSIEIF